MKLELTLTAKKHFLKTQSKLALLCLKQSTINMIIYRWFNQKTNIAIDIQHWENDGFDYAVTHPYLNKVFISKDIAGQRTKDFDLNLRIAISIANEIYNKP